jgi:hypothetical protein
MDLSVAAAWVTGDVQQRMNHFVYEYQLFLLVA